MSDLIEALKSCHPPLPALRLLMAAACCAALVPAVAQHVPTLPGAWPLTGQRDDGTEPAPLPDRSIEIPREQPGSLIPGVGVSAGYLFDGRDPLAGSDPGNVLAGDRELPREYSDQPEAAPGLSITVPFGR
jgi:hypothetical protein